MKLFSPQQNKDKKEGDNIREMLRTKDIQSAADKARKNLANAEADFKLTLAKNRDIWIEEEQQHSARISEMEVEVQLLENRKQQALIPINIYKEEASALMNKVKERENEVTEKEKDIERTRDALEDRLDEVGKREQDAKILEQKLAVRQLGINEQVSSATDGLKRLTSQIEAFKGLQERAIQELDTRKTAIILEERTIETNRESLKRTEKSLSEWAIRLKDKEETIKRTIERLKPTNK